jgi:predicted nucleic acid-binding protein
LDDLDARRVARRLSLEPIGTVGLLLAAKKRGLIVSLKAELDQLKEMGFWISMQLRVEALKEAGGRGERRRHWLIIESFSLQNYIVSARWPEH